MCIVFSVNPQGQKVWVSVHTVTRYMRGIQTGYVQIGPFKATFLKWALPSLKADTSIFFSNSDCQLNPHLAEPRYVLPLQTV